MLESAASVKTRWACGRGGKEQAHASARVSLSKNLSTPIKSTTPTYQCGFEAPPFIHNEPRR